MSAALDILSEKILNTAGLELTQTLEQADADELHDLIWTAYAVGYCDGILTQKRETA